RIAAELPGPQTVADDGHAAGAELRIVVRPEQPAAERLDAEQVEVVRARHHRRPRVGLAGARPLQPERKVAGEAGEYLLLIAIVLVVLIRARRQAEVARLDGLLVLREHLDDARRILNRERMQKDGVDHGEDRRVGADAEGQRQHGHRRESRLLDQYARRKAQILPPAIHVRPPANRYYA